MTSVKSDNVSMAQVPIKAQLQKADSTKEVAAVLLASLSTKLRASLFLSDSEALSPDTPLIDLGVDSLVGVDVRTWLLQELSVDVPVLKILGGASVSDLIKDIMEKLPKELPESAEDGDTVSDQAVQERASDSESGKSTPLSGSAGTAASDPTTICDEDAETGFGKELQCAPK